MGIVGRLRPRRTIRPNVLYFPTMAPRLGELTAYLATTAGDDGGGLRAAGVYFVAITSLLVVFLVIVAGLMLLRLLRRTLRARPGPDVGGEPEGLDPWHEAGRRTKPYPRPPGDEGED